MNTTINTNNVNPADEVWAMLKALARSQEETNQQMKESWQRLEKNMDESQRRSDESWQRLEKNMNESQRRSDESWQRLEKSMDKSWRRIEKSMDESQRRLEKSMDESWRRLEKSMDKSWRRIDKTLGGHSNSLGSLVESMFSAKLRDKLNEFGYLFNTQANQKQFCENKRVIAEADFILENGEYAMIVEVKTKLSSDDINEHLERIATIRRYMDGHGDNRKLVGAVAGVTVPENVLKYAQKKGLFVIVQTGDSIDVAPAPDGFKPHEW